MPDDFGGQKRVSDPLELELLMVVDFHMGAGPELLLSYRDPKLNS